VRMNADALKGYCFGRWPSIIGSLAPHLNPLIERGRNHGSCPRCGGKDRARCHNDFQGTGGVICNQCDGGANGFSVLMWANDWTFAEAIEAVKQHLGLSGGQPPATRPSIQKIKLSPSKNWDDERQRLKAVWDDTVNDAGRIIEYFKYRGLSIPVPSTLRLHPSLNYFHQGPPVKYPCMIARITRGDESVGLHRTWLDPDGQGKAPCSQPRKTWKCVESMTGGAIQLYPLEEGKPLVIAEGVETALAIREMTGFPVWSAISSRMLEKVEVPAIVEAVLIGADKDKSKTGQRAAEKLANRLTQEGREVQIALPFGDVPENHKSIDWLDELGRKEIHA
jgi:putative DNA primase/helicase